MKFVHLDLACLVDRSSSVRMRCKESKGVGGSICVAFICFDVASLPRSIVTPQIYT
jgi:hypothetical protein